MPEPPKLKYLFEAEFIDGTVFKQTPEDKSSMEPDRNCYFDVLEMVKNGKTIRRFSLVSEGNRVTVDLGTGIFYINHLAVLLESEKLPRLPDKFDLVWYHQVTQNKNITFEKKTGTILKTENEPEFREYFIGWQANINGKNYKQKIAVS